MNFSKLKDNKQIFKIYFVFIITCEIIIHYHLCEILAQIIEWQFLLLMNDRYNNYWLYDVFPVDVLIEQGMKDVSEYLYKTS